MRKLLLFPLRLSVGWGLSPRLLGLVAATMLVLLRLSIGWHFYSEGVDKYRTGTWDAAPFFANASGPFAEHYRGMVWDADGSVRRDIERSKLFLAIHRDRVINHYGFDGAQQQRAQENYAAAVGQQESILEDFKQDLVEYDLGAERIAKLDRDPSRDGVSSLRGQRDTIRRENDAKLKPAMSDINQIWLNYGNAQNAIATQEQKSAAGILKIGKPRSAPVDTSLINQIVPYFDIAIGLCLLLGLFTPLAALAAAGFLGSVFLSQYPPTTGPGSTNYQLVESMACLVLAGTGAGRFAGLDYFLHLIVRKVWGVTPASGRK